MSEKSCDNCKNSPKHHGNSPCDWCDKLYLTGWQPKEEIQKVAELTAGMKEKD